jgi:hypothetical protein
MTSRGCEISGVRRKSTLLRVVWREEMRTTSERRKWAPYPRLAQNAQFDRLRVQQPPPQLPRRKIGRPIRCDQAAEAPKGPH